MNLNKETLFTHFKKAFALSGIFLLIVFLISCFSSWINPLFFKGITFLAIGFPIVFIAAFIWCLIGVFLYGKAYWICFLFLLPAYFNLTNIYSFQRKQDFNLEKPTNQVRILSWNVNEFLFSRPEDESWKYDQQKMLTFIKEMNADILCFQDFIIAPGWAERDIPKFLHDSLGYTHQFFSEDGLAYGTIILSKFPIKDSGRIIYNQKLHPESIAYADVLIGTKALRVFNTHFRSMFLHHNLLSKEVLGELKYVKEDTGFLFKSTRLERLEYYDRIHTNQAKQVIEAFNQTSIPFIFCADLNAVPGSYTYRLLRKNTKDAFLEKGAGVGGTYKRAEFISRIDYILTGKEISVKQYYSPKLHLSDHNPVIADIQLAN
ncbi:endonuclease/exonuclease/phosphatase family protein [Sediminibacterium sp.]|uniref:endonuclease/exonuclease/phosphatase family protein n=1 Tax=Sediminibacterium sp. TaxID=1917865 RepID=UPI003F71C145